MSKRQTGPVVRALDLGFGFTKYSKGHLKNGFDLDAGAFASFAARSGDASSVGHALGNLDVLTIDVDGVPYTVGNDSKLAASGQGRQMLESSFFVSPQYLAIARGAMSFMDVPESGVIDELVVGLPLNVYSDQTVQTSVVSRLTATHVIPSDEMKREITVRNVTVLPQIMGSLIALSVPSDRLGAIQQELNLTIDVGYGTLLWLVTAGMKPIPNRSGGNMGGVSSILKSIAAAISPSAADNVGILDRLDNALYSKLPSIKVGGNVVELDRYLPYQQSVIRDNFTQLLDLVGKTDDIDNIFLTGGGSEFYREAIKEAFPGRSIPATNLGGRYTNLQGFQIFGERKQV